MQSIKCECSKSDIDLFSILLKLNCWWPAISIFRATDYSNIFLMFLYKQTEYNAVRVINYTILRGWSSLSQRTIEAIKNKNQNKIR